MGDCMSADPTQSQTAGAGGFTLTELETYWEQTHRQIAEARGPAGAIVEANPKLMNLFDDFAHSPHNVGPRD